ncbi:MAG: hypothetical protein HKP61_02300 [Dactylosporangium sp.]|nr:nitrate- and nitrite sensing domain-containing protein [Dactylosporangium sp.]NNJ59793.1 hypothetical protein [Dactylosporangium sp.]
MTTTAPTRTQVADSPGSSDQPRPPLRRRYRRLRAALGAARRGLRHRRLPDVQDWRVRTKLGAVLAVPATAFFAIAGIYVDDSIRQSTTFGNFVEEIAISETITDLVYNLQTERDHAAGYLATSPDTPGRQQLTEQFTADQAAVHYAQTQVETAIKPLQTRERVAAAYAKASAGLDRLSQTRAGIRDGWLRQRAVFEQYSLVIADLLAVLPTRFDLADAPDLARQLQSFSTILAFEEYTAQLRGRLFAAATADAFNVDDVDVLNDLRARQVSALTAFREEASRRDVARFDEIMRSQLVVTTARLQQSTMERTGGQAVELDPAEWWQASSARLDLAHELERELLAATVSSAVELHRARGVRTVGISLGVLLTVGLALLLSWNVGRSMGRSLLALRTQALDVAQHRLPAAIARLRYSPTATPVVDVPDNAVRSSDEIGEVSEAFTMVHRSAVMLAAEQAVLRHNTKSMFINLARRSQILVERQLQLLDRLEVSETDPDQLSNLFLLDHLATRMRRNDENLLVLAGCEAIRSRTEPIGLASVVLAAVAEIEHYARISRDVTAPFRVVGHAVSDVVHLLAELLENATAFSPPDSLVTVAATVRSNGDTAITITDQGIGLTDEGLAEANARLSDTADIDVEASERMGLVVVGHLASKHKILVRLDATNTGAVAQVLLPAKLLAPAELSATPMEVPPEPGPAIVRRSIISTVGSTPERLDQPAPVPSQSVWWPASTDQAAEGQPAQAPVTVAATPPRRPVTAGTSTAGLPIRVPNAQLPDNGLGAASQNRAAASDTQQDLDPSQVGATLSAFHDGVHRADLEADHITPLDSHRQEPA